MAEITASLVKELRERTGLGMMECKKVLQESAGDIELAIENFRKNSGMKAAKKADRTASDGVVDVRSLADGKTAVLLEVNSETDFVARDENFRGFVNAVMDRAMQDGVSDIETLMAGDLNSAREALIQKIGENITVRRMTKVQTNGQLGSYVHGNSRIAVLVELTGGSEELARDIAMHVAASNPQVTKPEQMSAEIIEKEREIYTAQAADSGKPAEIVAKMVDGRVRKFLAENSLTEQPFVKDPDVTVGNLLKKAGVDIVDFIRYEVGEGIEKKEEDFAAEVAKQVQNAKG